MSREKAMSMDENAMFRKSVEGHADIVMEPKFRGSEGPWMMPHKSIAGKRMGLKKDQINLPENTSFPLAMHEAGHVMGEFGGKPSIAGKITSGIRRAGSVVAPAAALYGLYKLPKTFREPESDDAKRQPLVAAAAGGIHLLPGEGHASIWATNQIRKLQGNKAALRAAGKLLPAWMTYAVGPLAAAGGMEALRRIALRRKQSQLQKTAMEEKTKNRLFIAELGLAAALVGGALLMRHRINNPSQWTTVKEQIRQNYVNNPEVDPLTRLRKHFKSQNRVTPPEFFPNIEWILGGYPKIAGLFRKDLLKLAKET
jgi:hypothetical protein